MSYSSGGSVRGEVNFTSNSVLQNLIYVSLASALAWAGIFYLIV